MANSFANYHEPFINGSTLKRLYSSVVKENIFQLLIARNEEACTEKYCEDTTVSQVTVLRVLPGKGKPRSLGGTTNNGFFNSDPVLFNETVAYPINLLDLVDYMTDIPEVQQDMMSTDLAAVRAKILGGQVARQVNAITIAAQLAKNFNDIANGKITSNWQSLASSPADKDYLGKIVLASAALDNGNEDEGIDTYPVENRAIFLRSTYKAALMQTGSLLIGGSNYAQKMVADGGLSPGDKSDNVNGYCGKILDMPVYMVGGAVWNAIEAYLGLAKGALAGVLGVIVSAIGTGRGLAFNSTIKQIDSPSGAGIRMQPLYRFGAECWDGLSVVPILANGFTNPATAGANLTVMAAGSRQVTTSFNAGTGGSGTVASIVSGYGDEITLPASTGLTPPSGKVFKEWNTVAAGTGTAYDPGDTYTAYVNTTLYAVYE